MNGSRLTRLREDARKSPDDPALQLELARVALRAGQYDEANTAAIHAARSSTHTQEANLILARLSLIGGRHAEAEAMCAAILQNAPLAEAHNIRGEALGNLGDIVGALREFEAAVEIDPAQFAYRFNLGFALHLAQRYDDAVDAYKKALEAQPGNLMALNRLSGALVASARYDDAVAVLRQVLERTPEDAVAWTSLGAALQFLGRFGEAKRCYLRALELDPRQVDAYSNLGTVSQGLRDSEAAENAYSRALQIDPAHQDALAGMASLMDWQGRYQSGLDLITPWIERGSRHPELLVSWAALMRHSGRQQEAIDRLRSTLVRTPPAPSYQQRLYFLLGDLLNDLQQYDDAFAAYAKGNSLKKVQFDPRAHSAWTDRVIEYFTREKIAELKIDGGGENMIFIVGMPRSGSSLVEQVLAAHPAVCAGGEMLYLNEMIASMAKIAGMPGEYPRLLDRLGKSDLRAAAHEYLQKASAGAHPDHRRISDKMPSNFAHLGLINALFPDARVIHTTRHPLDTGLSCYFQNFSAPGMHFAFDLQNIAHYFRDYRRLTGHFSTIIDLPFLQIKYEEMVADFAAQARQLVEFAGLEWDPACLEFYRLGRTVTTASHAQVRKPVYSGSSGRYRHYLEHLQPLVDGLAEDLAGWSVR